MSNVLSNATDILLTEAAKLANENEKITCSCEEIKFSKEHEGKMKKLFKAEKRKMFFEKIRKNSKAIACVLVVIIVASGATIYGVAKLKEKNETLVWKNKETELQIMYFDEDKTEIIDEYVFKYIPEGFKLIKKEVKDDYINAVFSDGEKAFDFEQILWDKKYYKNTDDPSVKKYMVRDYDAWMRITEESIILKWNDGKYAFTLKSEGEGGHLSEDEMANIAHHIELVFSDDIEYHNTGRIFFGYIPRGFKVEEESASDSLTYTKFHDGVNEIIFRKECVQGLENINTENAEIKQVEINGAKGSVIKKDNLNLLVWHCGENRYTLESSGESEPVSVEEIIRIAKKIEDD